MQKEIGSVQLGVAKRSVWWIVWTVVGINVTAFLTSMAFEPAGFDHCEAVPARSQVVKQLWVEGVALTVSIVALCILVIGFFRSRTSSPPRRRQFVLAGVIVAAMTCVVSLRWIAGFGSGGGVPHSTLR